MKVAITGGTGFVGSHLVSRLGDCDRAPEFVLTARGVDDRNRELLDRADTEFVAASIDDREALRRAFDGCDAVAHLAGINRERDEQTYDTVHIEGTRAAVEAAEEAGVSRILLTSYLRARPDCGSGYHESKWAAEEIVRESSLSTTVLKPGIVYGPGDQMLRGIARSLATVPVFPTVGFSERHLSPLAVDDLVDVITASLIDDRLADATVALTGPEELTLRELVERVGDVIGRKPRFVPTPLRAQYAGSWLQEQLFETPIVAIAGVRMLAEGATEPAPEHVCDPLPEDLEPDRAVTHDRIAAGLSDPDPIGLADLRIG